MSASPGEVTILLGKLKQGDKGAEAELFALLYKELRRIAGYYMRYESASHTLQPTALVNEAYLRLLGQTKVEWKDRSHFLGLAAQLMRRILVDRARQRVTDRRGGRRIQFQVENLDIADLPQREEVLAVHEALNHLGEYDPSRNGSSKCVILAVWPLRRRRMRWASLRERSNANGRWRLPG